MAESAKTERGRVMGFSSGISEPIERPRVEYDPDEAYERSLEECDDPCVIEPYIPEGWPDE